MERKVINVTVADGGHKKSFSVRLFGAMEGLDFLDKLMQQSSDKISIKNIMGDLLPLATLLGPQGDPIDTMSMSKVETYFQSPLAVVELAIAIFKHQMVFMTESEAFRKFKPEVEKMFSILTSDSVTQ